MGQFLSQNDLQKEAAKLGLNLNYKPQPIMNDIRLLPDEYWHESRRTGWGGSNEGTLNGMGYGTLVEVVNEKLTGNKSKPDEKRQHIFDYGHIMECLLLKRYAEVGNYKFMCYQNHFVIIETNENVQNKFSQFQLAQDGVWSFLTQNLELAKQTLDAVINEYPQARLLSQDTMEPKDIEELTDDEIDDAEMNHEGFVCVDRRQYKHPLYPHMIGDCDGLCVQKGTGRRIGLECKTYGHLYKGTFTDGVLGDDGVSIKNPEYALQVAHYMAVLNINTFDIIASCGNSADDVTITRVYRDLALEKELCENCEKAWEDYIVDGKSACPNELSNDTFKNLLEMSMATKGRIKDVDIPMVNNGLIQEKIELVESLQEKIKMKNSEKELLEAQANKARFDIYNMMDGHDSIKLLTDNTKDYNYLISLKDNPCTLDKDHIKYVYPEVYKEIFGTKPADELKKKYPQIYSESRKEEISSTSIHFRKTKK